MGFYDEQSFLVEIASMFELQHAGVMNHTGSGLVGIANRSISKCIWGPWNDTAKCRGSGICCRQSKIL